MKKVVMFVLAVMISIVFVSTGFTQDKPAAPPEKAGVSAPEKAKEEAPVKEKKKVKKSKKAKKAKKEAKPAEEKAAEPAAK
jgi:hypothetical protein